MKEIDVRASGAAAAAVEREVPPLVEARFASRLFAQDHTLWGQDAEEEAAKRLSWVTLAHSSRPLIERIESLRDRLREEGVNRIVLCGMGGSSLAPEVICETDGVPLVVLDSSDPDVVREAMVDLDVTAIVVSSKSGSTVETDSQRRAFEQAFRDAGINPAARIVVVTDPGSPLDTAARADGYEVINADPDVGGRFSALTAFGLVPCGLAGADIGRLLDEAADVTDVLAADDVSNPGLVLGAAIAGTEPLRDKLVLVADGTHIVGFPAWAEQLVAESTGKQGTGILPVVGDGTAPRHMYPDGTVVRLLPYVGRHAAPPHPDSVAAATPGPADPVPDESSLIEVSGTLGGQFLLWEVAISVAGRLLGINPFDQPDVESAKAAARTLLDGGSAAASDPAFVDGSVEVRAVGGDWLGDATTLPQAVTHLLRQLDDQTGYVAVMAYLDRHEFPDLEHVARELFDTIQRPVTFGWGPRFLHSTGQYHKGGPPDGIYLQITAEPEQDLAVPGREFTFGEFIAAQAGGDANVLADHGRPVLRLHLLNQDRGVNQVQAALSEPRL